jgi:hypothetical protein
MLEQYRRLTNLLSYLMSKYENSKYRVGLILSSGGSDNSLSSIPPEW